MPSISDEFADEFITHAINLQSYAENIRRPILEFLDDLEEEIRTMLAGADLAGLDTPVWKRRRLETLLKQIDETVAQAYNGAREKHEEYLLELAPVEGEVVRRIAKKIAAFDLFSGELAPTQLRVIATQLDIFGAPAKYWWEKHAERVQAAFREQIRFGVSLGESNNQIISRVLGERIDFKTITLASGKKKRIGVYSGGAVTGVSRREADALVRTSVMALSNQIIKETYDNNADLLKGYQHKSTLDTRTCFPAGTKIETSRGWMNIEDIHVGDFVKTHRNRFRKVLATKQIQSKKPLTLIETLGGRKAIATSDHLFLTRNGWEEVGSLRVGADVVVGQKPDEISEHLFAELASEDDVRDSQQFVSRIGNNFVFSPIIEGSFGMPVIPINLYSEFIQNQKIQRVAPELHFAVKRYFEKFKAFLGVAFRNSRRFASPVTSHAAKLSTVCFVFLKTNLFSAGKAVFENLMGSTLQRAMLSSRFCLPELLSADYAGNVNRSACSRASAVPACDAGGNGEVFSTHRTFFDDLSGLIPDVAISRAVSPFMDGVEFKRTFAEVADFSQSNLCHLDIVSRVDSLAKETVVYDLETEEDHSFVANGFVVHNSAICRARSGLMWDLEGKPIGNHNFPFQRPPIHYRCRSFLLPLIKSWKELGSEIDLPELPKGTQASMDGQVSADLNYEQWFKLQVDKKGDAWGKEILGPARFAMWKAGKITMPEMVDNAGRRLTIEQLKASLD